MKKLIITADDLGLTNSVNEGIAMAMKEGILSYVSVLPAGDAFDDAARVIKELGLKEAGAHLALTEVSAVCDPFKVPSLVRSGRWFNKGRLDFFLRLFLGQVKKDEIRVELKAQPDRLKTLGVKITALSGHEDR